jgi:hypothetical protein
VNRINPARAVERCVRLADLGPPPPWSRPWKLKRWLRAFRAIMALDISEEAEMLRSVYSPSAIEELAQRTTPWMALARKHMDATRKP